MLDPAYLRAQAELCFAIADLMSTPEDARLARIAAEHYVSRAEKAECEHAAVRAGNNASGRSR